MAEDPFMLLRPGGPLTCCMFWCNKGHGMCCSVCGIDYIKDPLQPIEVAHVMVVASSLFIYPMPYNHK